MGHVAVHTRPTESTRDYSSLLAVPAALALLRWLRPAAVRVYCADLAAYAAAELPRRWGTDPALAPPAATAGLFMATAELPAALLAPGERAAALKAAKKSVHAALLREFSVEVPLFVHADRLLMRVSCYVYNSKGDIDRLATAVEALASRSNL